MNDVWARVALIAAVFLVAGAIALWRRRASRRPVRDVEVPEWSPGIYFFSSETCPTCAVAREKLNTRLGEAGYTEFAWERDSERFGVATVDVVPCVVVVDDSGMGRIYPGQPDRALARL